MGTKNIKIFISAYVLVRQEKSGEKCKVAGVRRVFEERVRVTTLYLVKTFYIISLPGTFLMSQGRFIYYGKNEHEWCAYVKDISIFYVHTRRQ